MYIKILTQMQKDTQIDSYTYSYFALLVWFHIKLS